MKALQHFCTITAHRHLVMKGCFKVGLYQQGICHDLSKYSPTEFLVGCQYYQGNMSPNNAERKAKGYSAAWLHHKGRNKHHYEYWIDYSGIENIPLAGMKMPIRYVVEMFIDRVSASKIYKKDGYNESSPLEYYEKGKNSYVIHPESRALLELLLHKLADEGENAVIHYIRTDVLKNERKK